MIGTLQVVQKSISSLYEVAVSERRVACTHVCHNNFLSTFEVTGVFPWFYCFMDEFEGMQNIKKFIIKIFEASKFVFLILLKEKNEFFKFSSIS